MDTPLGRNLILWTVRLSVALYCYAVWLYLSRSGDLKASCSRYAKVWFCSWLMCMIHVVCAYHFEHRWSQAAALKHTAVMTDRVVGWHWAGGLYVNYVFLLAWGIDAYRCCRMRMSTSFGMQIVAAFMMFNATVVFGPVWWVIPAGVFGAVLWLGVRTKRFGRNDDRPPQDTPIDGE